jgi:protein-tyrosine phosphatase
MAEGILRHRAAEAGLPLTVSSAGSFPGGSPATPDAIATCAEMGIDISNHRSRRLDRSILEQADLVLAMTREHLREAVVTDPSAFGRIFTLREFARKAKENPGATLAELGQGRVTREYLHAEPADDVADPIGKPRAEYVKTAKEIDALLAVVVSALPHLATPNRTETLS